MSEPYVYNFADVDLWIETCRQYVKQTGHVPISLMIVLDRMSESDARLAIYAHARFLHYPSLKKTMMQTDDEDGGGEHGCGKIPKVKSHKFVGADLMFR